MKKKLFFFFIFAVLFVSCQENSELLAPENNSQITSLDKSSNTFASDSYTIDGSEGGQIKVEHNWINDSGKKVKLNAKLNIPRNAFKGSKEFYMVFNLDKNSVNLFPSPTTFDKPLSFSLKYKNTKVDYTNLVFTYLDGYEVVEFEENIADTKNGTLAVKNAKLYHFSEWGWDRPKP